MKAPIGQTGELAIVRPTDWLLGSVAFPHLKADWRQYLPSEERQRNSKFDSNFCTTYSGLNVIESILNYHIAHNLLPQTHIDFLVKEGYMDIEGKVNFNETFCAKLNGTTINGLDLGSFWQGVRNFGLVPQNDWIDVRDAKKWDDLMKPIPQKLLDKGKKFLEYFEVNYAWSILDAWNGAHSEMEKALAISPLHVAAPVCPGWNSTFVKACDLTRLAHATMRFDSKWGEYYEHFDHYSPYIKKLEWNYTCPYAITARVTAKPIENKEEQIRTVATKLIELLKQAIAFYRK